MRVSPAKLLLSVFLALSLVACTGAPIRNVPESRINTSKAVSMEEVQGAIKRAGAGLGWRMADDGPGKMIGTLNLRRHTAVVDVVYDTSMYSIVYKDSNELDYRPARKDGQPTIHKNYNSWVTNLDNAIQRELAAL